MVRNCSGSSAKRRVAKLKPSVTPVKERMNPSATKSTRDLLWFVSDVPTSIGRTGSVHGAVTVAKPARKANKTLIIVRPRFIVQQIAHCRWWIVKPVTTQVD